MKVTTDTSGKTTCELSANDRRTLAGAKTIIEQLAFHYRTRPDGQPLAELASAIGAVMRAGTEGEQPEKPAEEPKQPTK
jgi:hypothetical protein